MKKAAIICLLFLSLSTISLKSSAQTSPHADHIALYVNNLNKSLIFYRDVMQLQVIPEPFHDGKHVWMRTGKHSQLHLIQGAKEVMEHDINSHFAYSVPDLAAFEKHLDDMHIKYGNWTGGKTLQLRPDGVKQIYFQDPDNYWIEVNDDKF
jgi:lactoylglutathione lyase